MKKSKIKPATRSHVLRYIRFKLRSEVLVRAYLFTPLSIFGDKTPEQYVCWAKKSGHGKYAWNEILGVFRRMLG